MANIVVVTGGLGYIGSHSVIELAAAQYTVVIIDNLCNSSLECLNRLESLTGQKIPFYKVDILHEEKLKETFGDITQKIGNIRYVMHFAGWKSVGESVSKPLGYYENNVMGTISLLKVMKNFGVCRFIFSSSCTVYGVPQKLPFDESHSTGQGCTNPYGKSKFFIEEILKDVKRAHKEWNIVILRYFNPVGAHKSGIIGEDPKDIPNNLMPYITQVAVGKREIVSIFGGDYDTPDGTGVRDYIHVVDLAKGHVAAMKKVDEESCGLKIYNLGTGQGYSVKEMIAAMSATCGHEIASKVVGRREGDLACVYGDSSLALREMGWKTEMGLQEMCDNAWRWQSQNPDGFEKPNNV